MATFVFTQLDVWQKAHELALKTYRATDAFPRKERFRLTQQATTAAVSISANIAEGYGRRSPRDKMRFCNHSEGSLQELRNCYLLAKDLGYMVEADCPFDLIRDVESMLRRLISAIGRDL